MDNLNKYLRSQERLAKQLEQLYHSPLADIITHQERLYSNLASMAQSAFPGHDAIAAIGLLNSQITSEQKLFKSIAPLQDVLNNVTNNLATMAHSIFPEHDTVTAIRLFNSQIASEQELFKSLAPLQEMLENATKGLASPLSTVFQDSAALSSYLQSVIPESLQQHESWRTFSGEQFKNAFEPFLSNINDIRVHPEYVEIPRELIPDQIVPQSEKQSKSQVLIDTLSHPIAQYLINNILIPFLIGLLLQNLPQPGQATYQEEHLEKLDRIIQQNEEQNQLLSEQNNLLSESNRLQEEENELLKTKFQTPKTDTSLSLEDEDIEKILYAMNYLLTISEQLEVFDTVPSTSDNSSAKIQSLSSEIEDQSEDVPTSDWNAAPISQSDGLPHPIAPDSSDTSEL